MPDPHQILRYDYVADILDRRGPYREAHLANIAAGKEAGEIVMAGPVDDPPVGGMFVFAGADPAVAERFVEADPYVEAGLVTAWRVELWNVV